MNKTKRDSKFSAYFKFGLSVKRYNPFNIPTLNTRLKMKVLIFLAFIGAGLCLNVPSRSRSGISDPCSTSPCAKDATCETSQNGFAFCRCKSGFTGDAFVSCEEIMPNQMTAAGSPTTMASQTMSTNTMNSDHTTNQRPYPARFTVDYHTSTDTNVQDMSRIPILGSTATATQATQVSLNQDRVNTQIYHHLPPPTIHETVVHTHIQRYPSSEPHLQILHNRPQESQNPVHSHVPSSSGLFPSSHAVVLDPMGQYSNCRSIRGVIVCADNSVDDSPNGSPSLRPEIQGTVPSSHQTNHHNHPMESNYPSNTNIHNSNQFLHTQIPHSDSSTSNMNLKSDCKSSCGINSICRMVNTRPVCGCPVDHTGDPGVRCDPIVTLPEETSGCQKHIECSPTEICADSKCIDPCQGGSVGGMCGQNAKCHVIQHTAICGCNSGFNGNPYIGCQ